uniref:Uncharacterized protein n=1 Tax=Glossina palpalis gambiensis TaxID=67801 RepID=A0A1B0BIJ1_9MUSC
MLLTSVDKWYLAIYKKWMIGYIALNRNEFKYLCIVVRQNGGWGNPTQYQCEFNSDMINLAKFGLPVSNRRRSEFKISVLSLLCEALTETEVLKSSRKMWYGIPSHIVHAQNLFCSGLQHWICDLPTLFLEFRSNKTP